MSFLKISQDFAPIQYAARSRSSRDNQPLGGGAFQPSVAPDFTASGQGATKRLQAAEQPTWGHHHNRLVQLKCLQGQKKVENFKDLRISSRFAKITEIIVFAPRLWRGFRQLTLAALAAPSCSGSQAVSAWIQRVSLSFERSNLAHLTHLAHAIIAFCLDVFFAK